MKPGDLREALVWEYCLEGKGSQTILREAKS